MYERRLLHLFLIFAGVFGLVAFQAFRLQVLGEGNHAEKLEQRLKRAVTILPRRGEILFADGTPMASNEPGYGVHVDLRAFDSHRFHCSACGLETTKRQAQPRPPTHCAECGADEGLRLRHEQRLAPVPLDDFLQPVSTPWDCQRCKATTEVPVLPQPVPRICKWCECAGTVVALPRPTAAELARLLRLDVGALHARMSRVRRRSRAREALGQGRFAHHVLVPRVEREVGLAVTLAGHRYPGLLARPLAGRTVIPFVASLVGRVRQPTPESFDTYTDAGREARGQHVYTPAEIYQTLFGGSGFERHYDEQLRGVPGSGQRVRSGKKGRGRTLEIVRPVRDGRSLRTTIEPTVQAIAHDLCQSADRAAAAVVIDLRDGAVIAMDSYTAEEDGFHHAAIHVAPGSVFKLVTAVAFLSAGGDPDDTLDCGGSGRYGPGLNYHCDGFHPDIDLETAFTKSCNYYFMRRADHAGPEAFAEAMKRLGLESIPPLPVKRGAAGLEYFPGLGRRIPRMNLSQMGIGQGAATSSPLQIAVAYGRMATGGRLIEPFLTEEERPTVPCPVDPMLARHAPLLRRAMERVVTEGTALRIEELAAVRAGGKTGTAEVPWKKGDPGSGPRKFVNNGWFVGYAPADDPRYVAVVVHERVLGHGADVAGKPVATLLAAALALDEVASER